MNIKLVFKLLGRILSMEAVALLLPMAIALIYRESPMPFVGIRQTKHFPTKRYIKVAYPASA